MPLPDTMRQVVFTAPGGPDVLALGTGPVPVPRDGEVLIEVAYAGVNRPDCLQRAGAYPPPPDASPILGLEVAGRVVALGTGVGAPGIGATVCALVPGGGYAEYCTAPAAWCLPIPGDVSVGDAAGLPETHFTVWNNVFDRGRLVAGETLLVHGGTSGIGLTAIQLAKCFGATVIATAGSPEKAAFCRSIGADHAIDYRTQDFVDEVARITGKRGVDVILDMVGGSYVPRELKSLADEGRLVFIAMLGGSKAELDINEVMRRRLTISGSTLRPRPVAFKGAIARSLREKIWPLVEAGRIKPVIYKTFALEQAADAHRLMESSQHIGKIVLSVSPLP